MEKFKINYLYSEMVKDLKKRPYQLLRGTKTLALSSPKYHSFYKSSNNSTQKKTFKLPNETEYPKLIKSKYISLKKKINTFSFSSKLNLSKKSETKPKSSKTNVKNFLAEKFKKKKNINFFVGENYYKRNLYNFFPKYKNNSLLNNMNAIYDSENNNNYLYSIRNSEKRIKDFFMLLNSIFYDEDYYYNDLKYNEKEIYGHKEEYLNYIKDELNYFLKKEKELDIKTDLLQIFNTKKYGKIELYLKSARLEVFEMDSNKNEKEKEKENKNIISINLPFHLLCLIYLFNGEQIDYFIIILLKKFGLGYINQILEENITISNEAKKAIFMEILDMVKFDGENIKFKFDYKNYERYYSKLKFLEKIKDITDVLRYNTFLSLFFKDHNKVKMIDNTDINIYNSPNYKANNIINFDTNINKYTLFIISLQKIYKIYFYLPEIELIFNDYKKQMNHFIDKELFLYLYQNNFMYWDYYVLHFLFSFKNFRKFMNGILSIRSQSAKNLNKINNNFFSKVKTYFKNNNNDLFSNNIIPNTINKCHLSNSYSYELNLNENCYEYIFLYSNNVNISIYKLKSYILYVFVTNINKPIIYEFNFNYQHMKILYYISLFENLTDFLKRLLYIKNNTTYFDYSYFESFTNMTNQEIYNYFKDVHSMNEENKLKNKDDNQSINSLTLRVCQPFIEVIDFNLKKGNNKIVQSNIKLKKEFIKGLINVKINTNEWINKINEYKNEFDIKYHIKYDETINKRVRRQITTGNKTKDFHKVFNKFLKIS